MDLNSIHNQVFHNRTEKVDVVENRMKLDSVDQRCTDWDHDLESRCIKIEIRD